MSDPLSCTSCGNPLAVVWATGLCLRCAPAGPGTESFAPRVPAGEPGRLTPPAALPSADTPNAAADLTPPQPAPEPNLHAPTHSSPAEAPTGSEPPPSERGWPTAPPGYVIRKKIGRGGMGDVYLAREILSDQDVALKFLRDSGDPALLDRFVLEFRALRSIVHPNAVRVLGHDVYRADPYLVLEYMAGGSLSEKAGGGPLEPKLAVEWIRKVAGAVRAMHESAGILHRDIKPGNVLLTAEGEPKLADFGLAKFLNAKTVHTLSGGMLGTLRYTPPEQINGKNGPLGYPADVYGLGATLYHLLTGRTPFDGEEVGELLFAVLNDTPTDPRALRPELTRGLSAVVMKCLEKDPRDRYQTVAEFLAALDLWAERDTLPPVPRRERLRKWVRRNRVALSACALLALGGAAVALAWPVDPERAIVAGLTSGKKHALIRDGVLVPAVRWSIRHPERAESKKDAGFAVLSQDLAVGVLLNDPGVTSYRLSGRFRQEVKLKNVNPQADATARTGLLIGHVPLDFGNGRVAHFATIVTFNDFDDAQNAKEVRLLEHEDFVRLELPLESPRRCNRGGLTLKLTRFEGAERPWREFAVEVRPTGLTISYNGQQTAAPAAFIQKNWDANAAKLAHNEPTLPAFVAPTWSPRLPLGLVSQMAWSNFDSLDIEPLP